MASPKIKKEEKWYTPLLMGIIFALITIYTSVNYDAFIHPERMGSGKAIKFFRIIVGSLDKIGGKALVMALLILITGYLFLRSYRIFWKQKNKKV